MSGAQPGRRWMCQSLGFVVCTSVTCVRNVAAVVAGYRSLRVGANGKARCGTEPSWAQLLLFMLRGREAGVRSDWCAESQPGAGVHREPDRGLGQPQALVPGLLPFSPVPAPSCGFCLVCTSLPTLIPSCSTLISLLCSADLAEFRFTFLPSVLKTIVKFLKRG